MKMNVLSSRLIDFLISILLILTFKYNIGIIESGYSYNILTDYLDYCYNPWDMYEDGLTGRILVTCKNNVKFPVLSLSHNNKLSSVLSSTQCESPLGIYKDEQADLIYIGCKNKIISIDNANHITKSIGITCNYPQKIAVDSFTQILYVACGSNGVIAINNTDTNPNHNIIPLDIISPPCTYPAWSVYFDSFTGILFIGCQNAVIAFSLDNHIIRDVTDGYTCQNSYSFYKDEDSEDNILYVACRIGGIISIKYSLSLENTEITQIVSSTDCHDASDIIKDSVNNRLYAICAGYQFQQGGRAIMINGRAITSLITCPIAQRIYKSKLNDNDIYVICHFDKSGYSNAIYRLSGNTVTSFVDPDFCPRPISVKYSTHIQGLIAACANGGIITATSSETHLISKHACFEPNDVYIDPNTHIIWASCAKSGIIMINGTHITKVANLRQCPNPIKVIQNEKIGIIYTICYPRYRKEGILMLINSTSLNITYFHIPPPCLTPSNLNIDPFGIIYVTCNRIHNFDGKAMIISIDNNNVTMTELANSTGCLRTQSITKHSNTNILYVACQSKVISIDGSIITDMTHNKKCRNPQNIFIDETLNLIYIACGLGDGVISISLSEELITETIASYEECQDAYSVTKDLNTGIIYAGCYGRNVVAIGSNFGCNDGFIWQYGACRQCSPGGYYNTSLALVTATCNYCPPGSVSLKLGSSVCNICPINTYAAAPASPCKLCRKGFYTDQPGSTTCKQLICEAGQEENNGKCQSCPIGFFGTGSAPCTPCPSNFYTPVVGSFECILCDNNGFSCSDGEVVMNAGFFAYLRVNFDAISNIFPSKPTDKTAGRIELDTFPCPLGFCMGGAAITLNNDTDPNFILYQAQINKEDNSEYYIPINLLNGTSPCAEYRDPSLNNTLCGNCLSDRVDWNGQCVECPETNGFLLFLLVFAAVWFIFILYHLSQRSRADSKILIFFVQTASLQLGSYDQYISWLGFIVYNPSQASGNYCLTPLNAYDKLLLTALTPVLLLVLLLLLMGLHYGVNKYKASSKKWLNELINRSSNNNNSDTLNTEESTLTKAQIPFSNYVRTVISIILFSYLPIASMCINYSHCLSVNGNKVLFSSPTIQCSSSQYTTWLPAIIIIFLLYICGLPIFLFIFLFKHREEIRSNSLEFNKYYGVLYESFSITIWFWLLLECIFLI